MNEITLRGFLRDIEYSHNVGDIEYEKANLICPGINGKEDDLISLRYKKFVNKYKEGDFVEITGNLRSYSHRTNTTNKVEIYVFTYFDLPEEFGNNVKLDGRICKMDNLHYTKNNKPYIHFILANNIFTNNNKKINSYIPCTAYGEQAEIISSLNVSDFIVINGEFHSHTFKKKCDNNEVEFRLAHEVIIDKVKKEDN